MTKYFKALIIIFLLIGLALIIYWFTGAKTPQSTLKKTKTPQVVAVEISPVLQQSIELKRTFSGALEPHAEFIVAPKITGRIIQLNVNIGDFVDRNQVVARLDNDEYIQAVTRSQADLAVAKANLEEAQSALTIAERELARVGTLRKRGVASESQYDTAKANQLTKQVGLNTAHAQRVHAQAALDTANLHLSYTKITAGWSGGQNSRVVAERFVDEGELVAVNSPLLRIVELDPIIGVIYVSERDYALITPGQAVTLHTDGYPEQTFNGKIERIAPVFNEATRQARVELTIDNSNLILKPGMFIRASAILDRRAKTTVIPESALTKRGNQTGVFVVSNDGNKVHWQPVQTGIAAGDRVEIIGGSVSGQVVTLGQQLLKDGSVITVPSPAAATGNSR